MSQQLQAQLQVLSFLGTVALTGGGVLVAVALAIAGRRRPAAFAAGAVASLVALYAITLLVLGATGRTRVLRMGTAKQFCEIDCHLAYAVAAVRATPVPNGVRYDVTVRTTFDETTVAPWRGDAPLYPNPRRVRLVGADGRAWPLVAASGTSLDTPLHPGESYRSTLTFELPVGADVPTAPRLELTEADAVTRVLLGHENSPLHGKTLLALSR